MGGNISYNSIRQDLLNYISVDETNIIMQQVNVVLNAKNEIIFKNIAHIKNVKISFANDIKNQIIAKTILQSTSATSAYNDILNKISEKQNQGGIFTANMNVLDMIKRLKNVVDVHRINQQMQNIRNTFDVVNSFQVINDAFVPSSSLEDVDLTATNELYNKQVYDSLAVIYSEIDQHTKDDEEHDMGQTADNTTALIAIAAVFVVGGFIYMNRQNK